MRLTITILFCLCSTANATFVAFSDGTKHKTAPLDIQGGMLQPTTFDLKFGPLWVGGKNGSLSATIEAFATVQLLQPVPVGTIDPSKFSVSNMTGSWGSHVKLPPQSYSGMFDLPIDIQVAHFGGVDDLFLSVVPEVSPAYIVNATFGPDNHLIQHTAPAMTLQYSAVPEPSQWLALGLIAVGCVSYRRLRNRNG